MNTKTLEKNLQRQIDQARQEYDDAARAVASGDANVNLAEIRERITHLDGELADVRAAIVGGEHIASERALTDARKARVRLLNTAAALVQRRVELASTLVEHIEQLGATYREFVQAGADARVNSHRGDPSRRTHEAVDSALGVQQGIDQLIAGLLHRAGLNAVMKEAGALWEATMRNGPSFVDIQVQRTGRAMTALRSQIGQENANAETAFASRR